MTSSSNTPEAATKPAAIGKKLLRLDFKSIFFHLGPPGALTGPSSGVKPRQWRLRSRLKSSRKLMQRRDDDVYVFLVPTPLVQTPTTLPLAGLPTPRAGWQYVRVPGYRHHRSVTDRPESPGAPTHDPAWPWRIAAEARHAWSAAGWPEPAPELLGVDPPGGLCPHLAACPGDADAATIETMTVQDRKTGARLELKLAVPSARVRAWSARDGTIPDAPELGCQLCAFVAWLIAPKPAKDPGSRKKALARFLVARRWREIPDGAPRRCAVADERGYWPAILERLAWRARSG